MLRRCVWSRNIKNGCSIYIYDISRLRVKKHWNNKFYYMVASCWLFLWDLYYDTRIHEHHIFPSPSIIHHPQHHSSICHMVSLFYQVLNSTWNCLYKRVQYVMWTEMWTVNKEGNRGWSPGQRSTVPTTNRAYKRRIAEHHFQTSYCHSPFVNPTFLRPFHWRIGLTVSIHVLFIGIGHEVRNGLTWVAGHSVRENGHF